MKVDIAKLRKQIEDYRSRTEIAEIDPSQPSVIFKAPVEAGLDRFIDVRNLPKVEDLPFVPERLRDFAFRFATEMKPWREWAKIYGVSIPGVQKWLRNEGVRALIALTRYERRIYHMGMILQIEKRMYDVINTILGVKITTDNMGTVLSTAQFVWKMLNTPEDVGDKAKGQFNINIGLGSGAGGDGQDNPYRSAPRNVTPEDREALGERIRKLKDMVRLTAPKDEPEVEE